jgi:hypothetical protein
MDIFSDELSNKDKTSSLNDEGYTKTSFYKKKVISPQEEIIIEPEVMIEPPQSVWSWLFELLFSKSK